MKETKSISVASFSFVSGSLIKKVTVKEILFLENSDTTYS